MSILNLFLILLKQLRQVRRLSMTIFLLRARHRTLGLKAISAQAWKFRSETLNRVLQSQTIFLRIHSEQEWYIRDISNPTLLLQILIFQGIFLSGQVLRDFPLSRSF